VWEPVDKPDPFYASIQLDHASVEYEARISSVIHAAVGARPVPPAKQKLNPYILYTKDEWARCKTELEAQRAGKKAGKDEIRAQLGLEWRNAAADVKDRYISRCKNGREAGVGVAAEHEKRASEWDVKAAEVREQFVRENQPPASFESGRKTRKQGSF
jgi:lysine-specific histone demethylase 1